MIRGFLFFILLFSFLAQAEELSSQEKFQQLQTELSNFEAHTNASTLRVFNENMLQGQKLLSSKDQKARTRYLELKNQVGHWEYVSRLSQSLMANFFRTTLKSPEAEKEISIEADHLAQALISGIENLRKVYKIHSFPLIHNFMIDLKLAKRGACKHWAEDLLKVMEEVPHPHFTAMWLEAFPTTMREHNVAALVPVGVDYREGIYIDPWRTAGVPFWEVVKEDHHHPWQIWTGYTPK